MMAKKIYPMEVKIPVKSWLWIKDESKRTGLSVEEIWGKLFGVKRLKVEILDKKYKWLMYE